MWGGQVLLAEDSFVARSYATVALKGEQLQIHRHAGSAGVALATPPLRGAGAVPALRLQYGFRVGAFDLGPRLHAWRAYTDAVDTRITTRVLGGALVLGWERPFAHFDLRAWVLAGVERWWQDVEGGLPRVSTVVGAGAGVGARLPLVATTFVQLSAELAGQLRPPGGSGARLQPAGTVELAFGALF